MHADYRHFMIHKLSLFLPIFFEQLGKFRTDPVNVLSDFVGSMHGSSLHEILHPDLRCIHHKWM